jgi:hypothetical protein
VTALTTRYAARGRVRLFTIRDGVERRRGRVRWSRRWSVATIRRPVGPVWKDGRWVPVDEESRDLGSLQLVGTWPPQRSVSLGLSAGGTWSETPWDAHANIAGVGAYLGIARGGKLAERLTRLGWREGDGKYTGRQITVHTGGDSMRRVYWSLWTHPHEWRRGRFASWREGSASLDPRDRLWGPARWDYTPVDAGDYAFRDPEDRPGDPSGRSYAVTFTLTRAILARPKRNRPDALRWQVEWECRPDGIPVHLEAEGSWKGSEVVASSLELSDAEACDPHWPDAAAAHLAVWIVKTRSEHRR